MRLLVRAIVVATFSLALGLGSSASADTSSPAARGAPKAGSDGATPSISPSASRVAETRETKPSDGAVRGESSTNVAQPGKVTGASYGSGKTEPSGIAGKRVRKGAKAAKLNNPIDPNLPLAQAPSFELRADGTSLVTLIVSKPAEITRVVQKRAKGDSLSAQFELRHCQVGVRNNMNPLVTAHFQTPLTRVVLRRSKAGATLRLDFREKVEITQVTKAGPNGTVLVQIVVPKATRTYRTAAPRRPRTEGESSDGGSDARLAEESPSTLAGPGPRP